MTQSPLSALSLTSPSRLPYEIQYLDSTHREQCTTTTTTSHPGPTRPTSTPPPPPSTTTLTHSAGSVPGPARIIGPANGAASGSAGCRISYALSPSLLPSLSPPLPLVKPLPLTNPRHPQANAPFFPEIASRYRRVHRHFNRAHRRHPLRVADDISEIADYMVALRHVQPWCGRGAVGMLVWEMEGLVEGLVDKAG